jgi:hypothetical protein
MKVSISWLKDYVAIALLLRAVRLDGDIGLTRVDTVIDRVAFDLCRVFEEDNELFDAERFLSAAAVRT